MLEWPEIQKCQIEEISREDYAKYVYYDPEHDVWFINESFYKKCKNKNV